MNIILNKLNLFLLFVILYIWGSFLQLRFVENQTAQYVIILNSIHSLIIGFLVSYIFYYLVVFLPERKRKKSIKENFRKNYLHSKERILQEILWAADVYSGEKLELPKVEDIIDVKKFQEFFNKENNKDVYYDFLNQMSSDAKVFQEILKELKIISKHSQYILNNYSMESEKHLNFFHNLENVIFSLESTDVNSDDIKPFSRFLWTMFSGFDMSTGQSDDDIVLEVLKEL